MKRGIFLAAVAVCFLPLSASANAGTPLMWAALIHLVFGNAVIGLGEGLIIALLFGRSKAVCIPVMIGANYLSAWLGGQGIVAMIAGVPDWNLHTAWLLFWILVAVAFVITLLLEWPLVAFCFRRDPAWLRRSLKATLLVQTLSYLCLFGWYWAASGKSLFTRMQVVPVAELRLPVNVKLLYIGSDGRIRERLFADGLDHIIATAVSTNLNDRLFFKTGDQEHRMAALCLRRDASREEQVIFENLPAESVNQESRPVSEQDDEKNDVWFNFGEAARLGQSVSAQWSARTGFWPIEGMQVNNKATGDKFHFAWETPFSSWQMRGAILLPGDLILFQLGTDQICCLDPSTRRVALVARGRGFTAALNFP